MKTDIKSGTEIVCINNTHQRSYLTLNKKYTVIKVGLDLIEIKDDTNELSRFYDTRFISLKQYRKQKLLKINQTR